MDEGHKRTEEALAALERSITKTYREARSDLQKTVDAYFAQFIQRDKRQKELLEAGEITEEQYRQWRLAQIGRGKRFEALRDEMAERYTRANEVAVSYVNDATPGIYSLNRNYAAYTIESVAGDVGFTLFDEQTVKRLIREKPDLMPYYPKSKAVKRGIDLAWGKQQITASVTSSILQGLSIGKMANDLQKRIEAMNRSSALRTARTAVTGAQNAGRMDSYVAAEKMGIDLKKEWLATLDKRTRHSHAALDGERVSTDKKFPNGCMFPGDPAGPAWEVYNCRCTMIAAVAGVDTSDAKRRARSPESGGNVVVPAVTYKEWEKRKTKEDLLQKETGRGIINATGLQFFAERDLKKQKTKSIINGLKNTRAELERHRDKVAHPEKYIADIESCDPRFVSGTIKHWQREIVVLETNIKNRVEELKERGEYNGE